MAQSKRKRKTKHRGTPAGNVVARGRTSRPTSRSQARQQSAQARQRARVERATQPPSWARAVRQAGVGAVIFFVALVLFKQPIPVSLMATALMFFLYIPMGYYIDSFLWKRMQVRLERQKRERKAEKAGDKLEQE